MHIPLPWDSKVKHQIFIEMEKYFIYKAFYYSLNESAERNNGVMHANDCKSLELLCKVEGEFIEAYNKMQEYGKELLADGWSLCTNNRSKNYGDDSYIKVEDGDDWRDGHSAEIIYSTEELALRTI